MTVWRGAGEVEARRTSLDLLRAACTCARRPDLHLPPGCEAEHSGEGFGTFGGHRNLPKQDELGPNEFGNAIRAPLGVHWGARESRGWRYWFYGADYTLGDQLAYLNGLPKVPEDHLRRMIEGKEVPPEFAQRACRAEVPKYFASKPGEFRILDHVRVARQVGRNWVARCPSCAAAGHDKSGDNLAIAVDEPRKYCCWAGCTKEMIRTALGRPIPEKRRT